MKKLPCSAQDGYTSMKYGNEMRISKIKRENLCEKLYFGASLAPSLRLSPSLSVCVSICLPLSLSVSVSFSLFPSPYLSFSLLLSSSLPFSFLLSLLRPLSVFSSLPPSLLPSFPLLFLLPAFDGLRTKLEGRVSTTFAHFQNARMPLSRCISERFPPCFQELRKNITRNDGHFCTLM